MAVRTGGNAPYAPPQAVLDLIRAYRSRGFQAPFTKEVLAKAGVKESVIIRTLQALKLLDLVNEEGNPTPEFEALRRVPESEMPDRLAALFRSAYADALQYLDLAHDSEERILDVFRHYEPLGQLTRIVTCFLGLCRAANLLPEGAPANRRPGPAPSKGNGTAKTPGKPGAPSSRKERSRGNGKADTRVVLSDDAPPVIEGLFRDLLLRRTGWSATYRDKYLQTFAMVLDMTIPIIEDESDDE